MTTLRVIRTRNTELFREILLQDKLWDAISEDGSIGKDEYFPDLEAIVAVALIADDTVRGFVISRQVTDSVAEAHVAISPDYWGEKQNVALGKMGCAYLFQANPRLMKLVASIPETDAEVLRFAQRVGFQREGINRKSFLRKGELLDQYYVGLCREKAE
jgi:RimJ/RimL family protein N-acetyltransferase